MATLKEVLASRETTISPIVYDGLSERMWEQAGGDLAFIGGLNVAASALALPDLGLMTMTEIVERARNIVRATSIPVICDGDTGYGGINNVRRLVMELEAAGVSAVTIEDQTFPCRCGWITGKTVIPVEEYLPKLRAAVAARKSKDFQIWARTDCKDTLGMDEVIRRLKIYADNGSDMAGSGSGHTLEEYRRMVKEIQIPVRANAAQDQFGVTRAQWEETGVKLVSFVHVPLFAAMKTMKKAFEMLSTKGNMEGMEDEFFTLNDIARILKTDDWLEWAEK